MISASEAIRDTWEYRDGRVVSLFSITERAIAAATERGHHEVVVPSYCLIDEQAVSCVVWSLRDLGYKTYRNGAMGNLVIQWYPQE